MSKLEDTNSAQQFSREKRWEIVQTLLHRSNLSDDANQAFRHVYPNLPEEMLKTAIFHTYVDGIGAAIDWLVDLELFLRQPDRQLDAGATYHLLYHLYNWHQFRALLPDGTIGVLERLQDIKELSLDGDTKAVLEIVNELESMFQGDRSYPGFQ